MKNDKGGILSNFIVVPVAVALMAGFFFLGYYVGKYKNKTEVQAETVPPLPSVSSNETGKQDEFTFYKTLTDKNEKTVSIEIKPKPAPEERKPEPAQDPTELRKTTSVQTTPKEKRLDPPDGTKARVPEKNRQTASLQPRQAGKKDAAPASAGTKTRYTVQVASYQEKEMAEDEVKMLKKRGYAAFIASAELPGKGMRHRVRLGSFLNKTAAEKLQKTLRAKEGLSPIVTLE